MTVLFSPFANSQFADNDGVPAQGYTITTYAAGSSTLLSTYTDSTGLSANQNPVTLNTAGRNPNGQFWLTSGLSYKFVLKDSGGVVVQTVDGITGTNDPTAIATFDQWVSYSGTPAYIGATSFSVTGDQTSTLHLARRVKTTNTGGTVYSTITASAFSAGITTVTLSNDSGSLDSGLSQVSYGLLSATNSSAPPLNRVYAEYLSNADLTTVIPFDDTIPQITEGTQVLAATLTPRRATSRVRVRVVGWGYSASSADAIVCAAFLNAGASAVAASISESNLVAGAGNNGPVLLEYEYAPASTSAQAFTIRVGGTIGTVRLNGTNTARRFGGVSRTTLIIEEIAV